MTWFVDEVRCLATGLALALGALIAPPSLEGQVACAEGGSLYGAVVSQMQQPVSGATIVVSWSTGQTEAVSDVDGAYSVCGLPPTEPITILAASDAAVADPVVIELPSADRFEFDLTLFVLGNAGTAGTGALMGVAHDADTGQPIAGARIVVVGAGVETLTNDDGAFRLERLPPGPHAITLEHVGYGSQTSNVEVTVDRSTVLRLDVSPRPIEVAPLEVLVEGTRLFSLETHGFYERQEWGEATGLGHFFTEDDITRRGPRLITQMIADVPGTTLDCTQALRALECQVRLQGSGCPRSDVYVDGVRVIRSDNQISRQMLDDLVRPHEIAGVEVHMGGASLTAEFTGSSGQCGVIAIWTK